MLVHERQGRRMNGGIGHGRPAATSRPRLSRIPVVGAAGRWARLLDTTWHAADGWYNWIVTMMCNCVQ